MDRLKVDFGRDKPVEGRYGRAALAVALLLVVVTFVADRWIGSQREQMAEQSAELRVPVSGNAARSAALTAEEALRQGEEMTIARQVAQQLSLPWGALFDALDAPDYERVTLVGVVPNAERQQVLIEAEAVALAEIVSFVRQLRNSGRLGDARLLTHEVVKRDAGQVVRFKVVGTWARSQGQ